MFAHIAIVQFWGVKLQNKIGLQTQIMRFFSKKNLMHVFLAV